MKIEIIEHEDWRPGGDHRSDAIATFNNDREDAVRSERHADPFSVECPAVALLSV